MILEVPLRPVPAQAIGVLLADQQVVLTLRQLASGLYINVAIENQDVVGLVVCQNMNRIVRNAYLGFAGDLAFYDTSDAREDPYYTGLGSRFQLLYLDSAELERIES